VQDATHYEDDGDDRYDIVRHYGHFRQRQHNDKQCGILRQITVPPDFALQRRIVTRAQIDPVPDAVHADQDHQYGLQDDENGACDGRDNRYGHSAVSWSVSLSFGGRAADIEPMQDF
jgi:hypothetical protein